MAGVNTNPTVLVSQHELDPPRAALEPGMKVVTALGGPAAPVVRLEGGGAGHARGAVRRWRERPKRDLIGAFASVERDRRCERRAAG